MTNRNIDLPSQRKYFDITAIEEAGDVYYMSGSKLYKYRQRPQNDLGARFLFILAVLGLLLGAWLLSHPESAKAKTIELRDCMTNKCICDELTKGFGNYFDSYKPSLWQNPTSKDEILAGCVNETLP